MKSFLNISGEVSQPEKFHKDRPIKGLECPRSEISGKRLWELASQLSGGKAEDFFRHAYVHNYNPLAYLAKSAKNITPAELKVMWSSISQTDIVVSIKLNFYSMR